MSLDSTPAALEVQREFWRRLGPEGRIRLAVEMSEDTRRVALAGRRARQPTLDADEGRRTLVEQLYDAGRGPDRLGSRAANSRGACGRPATETRHSARALADVLGLQTRSERQLRDVEAIVLATGDSLDRDYLLAWASELGMEEALHQLLG